jgi:hypothetical protein
MLTLHVKRCLIRSFCVVFLYIPFTQAFGAPIPLTKQNSDLEYNFWGIFRPETFYGENISLFNKCNPADKIWYMRHTLDYNTHIIYGKQQYGHPVAECMFSMRNRAVWGNLDSIASTSEAEVKIIDSLGRGHRHFIPRHFFWMREAWFRFSVPDVLDLYFENDHTFTIGAFPFELGRGIALGSAYAVGNGVLGFYTNFNIDQYAFGMKLSGELIKSKLIYDLYYSILDTKTSSLSDTGAKIRGQEFGKIANPARGFGRVNYLVAAHVFWYPLETSNPNRLIIEPYILYNKDPEQKVEFKADAGSSLITLGCAIDFVKPDWEIGVEAAFNLGAQHVRSLDRNIVTEQNRNGVYTFINSHVLLGVDPLSPDVPANLDPYKAPFAPQVVNQLGQIVPLGKNAQALIDAENEGEEYNGKLLGVVPGLRDAFIFIPEATAGSEPDGLYNAKNRYRNPYQNLYRGWMVVGDTSLWLWEKDLRLSLEGGIASGDNNPNFDTIDGKYSGFIGLEEIYSGRRVRSAFVLGGAGKIQRPLASPLSVQAPSPFEQITSGFTNLIYFGTSALWVPTCCDKRLSVNPNLLFYWQPSPSPLFDPIAKKDIVGTQARSHLGTELNLFAHYFFLENLKLYFVGSIFLPGHHYTDIQGKPLNADQVKFLDLLDQTGFSSAAIPNLSHDRAYTLNVGLEFKF